MSTHQIDGLTVAIEGDVPRVRDTDLAVRLGYERPRTIRDLIDRLIASKTINDSEVRRTARQTSERGGRPGNEYWLTEEQALLIAARSETPKATEMLRAIIDVFLAVKRGLADRDRIALYLRDVPDERWEMLFKHRVAEAIARLYGNTIDWSRGFPPALCGISGKLYDLILGRAVADEMRKHKVEDRAKGLRMHQRLTPEARQLMLAELSFVETMALQAGSAGELWSRLGNRYEGKPFQLSFGAVAPHPAVKRFPGVHSTEA